MTDKYYHAHNLDAYLDNLFTTLKDGYSTAMFDPVGEEEAILSRLFSFLEEHMNAEGFVRVSDKVRHNTEIRR